MACSNCFKGHPQDGKELGEMTTLHDMACYITPPLSTTTTSPSSIIYFCDGFGLNVPNNKLLADSYAAELGVRVIVPALPSNALPDWSMEWTEDLMTKSVAWTDIWGQLSRINKVFWIFTAAVPFIMGGRPVSHLPAVADFARKVKTDMGKGGKLGIAGFCWGGFLAVNLCKESATKGGSDRLIDASFAAHPGYLKPPVEMLTEAVTAYKTPLSLAHADGDPLLKNQAVLDFEEGMKKLKDKDPEVHYEVKIYPNQQHGFAVRGDHKDEKVLEAVEQAKAQGVGWFKAYL